MNKRSNGKMKYRMLSILGLVIFFGVWEAAVRLGWVSHRSLNAPSEVVETFIYKLTNANPDGSTLPQHFFQSLTAAGMSAMGKIPFTHTFTAFATRRVCDQVTLSVAYAGLNVKMMGSDPGVTAEYNGGTHMSMEDVSIMRNIPGMIVYEPVDSAQLKAIFPQIVDHYGPVYIRLLRRNAVKVFEDGETFELGKGKLMREGSDVSIFATGIMVADAVEAVEELEKEGIHAELINIHTVKPLDEEMVLASVAKTGCAVTAENHSVIGGLGSAVAELLVEKDPVPVKKVGVMDHFGEVGLTPYLKEKYGLTAKDIIAAAKAAIAMKKR